MRENHPHPVRYIGQTVEMSDGSERPMLGGNRPTDQRLSAIEAYLIETRRVADNAGADVKDDTTTETLQHRVSKLEKEIQFLRRELEQENEE